MVDHQGQLGDLGIGEMLAQLGLERVVDRAEVRRQLLGKANRKCLARGEGPLCLGKMDLRDRLLVKPLPRRRRVPSEQSGVALIQRRNLEPRELFDARRHDALLMARSEELEVPREEIGDEAREIEGLVGTGVG